MKNFIEAAQYAFAALGGALGAVMGGFDGFLYALVVFVVVDYITGLMAAAVEKKLSSEVGFKGIYQKICAAYHSSFSSRSCSNTAFSFPGMGSPVLRRWKRPLKKRARQVCRAMLRRMER